MMPWHAVSLRTRVARRILALFLLSALAPLCGFAGVSAWMVAEELRQQTLEHLRVDAKSAAMASVQRLQDLDARLRINADAVRSTGPSIRHDVFDRLGEGLGALLVEDASRNTTSLRGRLSSPQLSTAQETQLRAGRTVIAARATGSESGWALTMIVPLVTSGDRLIAELNPRVVWDLGEDSSRAAATGVCVFDHHRALLACSDEVEKNVVETALAGGQGTSGSLQWPSTDGRMLGGFWSAPLARQFAIPSWTFVITRSAADAEAPILRFRRAFAVVVMLTVALMSWVSLGQIRRTLEPLVRLREGAEQLRGGHFEARVDVSSGDEFEALAGSFNLMASEVQRQFADLKALNLGTLEALARAIDAKSPWTAGHSERVAAVGVQIGWQMGLAPDVIEQLHYGGLLHDIGKLGVPGRILDKTGALTEDEFALMRQHPVLGARILEPLPLYAPILPIVLEHHERADGSGYPYGLAGEAISLGGRIFAVADVFDAMSSDRPYRRAMPVRDVVESITAQSGRQFDPVVVEAFLRVVAGATPGSLSSRPPTERALGTDPVERLAS